jgi:DNA-binding transcriptional regulator YiaG
MKKIIKDYVYEGLGFPFLLHNVEVVKLQGELHPKIDVRKVADIAIKTLVLQKNRLTGNQIKFIRIYLAMSLRKFAALVNESHMAVKKWENFKDETTNMDRNIEIMIRLHVYNEIIIKKSSNKKNKDKLNFYHQFLTLSKIFSGEHLKQIHKNI